MTPCRRFIIILLSLYLCTNAAAFTVVQSNLVTSSWTGRLSMSDGNDPNEGGGPKLFTAEDIDDEPQVSSKSASTNPNDIGTSYPIPLPSPILLGGSMILAIASTGSIFELSGGNPQYGFPLTAAIAAIGVPSCFFLFYAAIKKGMAETEEDDQEFMRGR